MFDLLEPYRYDSEYLTRIRGRHEWLSKVSIQEIRSAFRQVSRKREFVGLVRFLEPFESE